jgi:hypothetical protein
MPAVVTRATLLSASGLLAGVHGTPIVSIGEKPLVIAFAKKGIRLVKLATFRFLSFENEFILSFILKILHDLIIGIQGFRIGIGRNIIE